MKKLFNFFISLFRFRKDENVKSIETSKISECTNAEMSSDVLTTPTYIDVFGNVVEPGSKVICLMYNDAKRRGYYTVKEKYIPIKVDVAYRHDFIDLEYFNNSCVKTPGHRKGFIHVKAI